MYELVNTSLPNGLIAGTHGFSTVAMTKGMPDILRGRLESLCAYTHRASVHDVTYLQQNPVNWFHIILPQGDHVVGRVAPYDFDYTGRTNRIARLRVFRSVEMPEIGGAEVLALEKRWFKERWEGDPCYLEENRNVCGQLRMCNPVYASSAPSWESVFGANGSRYAQQIAWQLEYNITEGGKPIYFKTSVEWDITGEKLLRLFCEVINLLPTAIRSKVTFSTYPVSLPGGISCNLRGVYDRDRLFDAASVSQTWVDCERGQVVHAELLPECDMGDSREGTNVTSASMVADVNETWRSNDSRLGVRRASSGIGDKNSYRNLILPQKKGPDMFIIGFVIAGLFVLLAAGLLFYFMIKSNNIDTEAIKEDINARKEVQKDNSEKAEVVSDNKDELNNQGQSNGLAQSIDSDKNTLDKKGATFSKNGHEKKGKDVEKERALGELKKRDQEKRKAAEAQAQLNIAYLDAVKISIGKPTMSKESKDFTKENGCRVYYYYDDGIVTNQPAEVVYNRAFNTSSLKWGQGKSEKDLPVRDYGFFVWYNPKLRRAYIDTRFNKENKSEKLFSRDSKDSVDLERKVFGPDKNIAKLWAKYQANAKVRYKVVWSGLQTNGWFFIEAAELKRSDAENKIKMVIKSIGERKIKNLESQKTGKEKDLATVQKKIEPHEQDSKRLQAIKKAYDDETEKITKINGELNSGKADKKRQEELKKEKKDCECKRKRILDQGSPNPNDKPIKGLPKYNGIKKLDTELGAVTNNLTFVQLKTLKKNIEDLIAGYPEQITKAVNQNKIDCDNVAKKISEILFTIELVDVHYENEKLGVK